MGAGLLQLMYTLTNVGFNMNMGFAGRTGSEIDRIQIIIMRESDITV